MKRLLTLILEAQSCSVQDVVLIDQTKILDFATRCRAFVIAAANIVLGHTVKFTIHAINLITSAALL